jgi:hypothetical protein
MKESKHKFDKRLIKSTRCITERYMLLPTAKDNLLQEKYFSGWPAHPDAGGNNTYRQTFGLTHAQIRHRYRWITSL